MIMRRLLSFFALCVMLVAMPMSASAQFDLSKAMGLILGGATKGQTQTPAQQAPDPYQKLADAAPSQSTLNGTWVYDSASFTYVGSNPLASMAIAQLDPVLANLLTQLGVTRGSAELSLRTGEGVITHNGRSLEGTYSYRRSRASIVAKSTIGGKSVSASGYVKYASGKLTVLLDVKEVLNSIKQVYPEYAVDPNVVLVETVLKDIGDVFVVGQFVAKR